MSEHHLELHAHGRRHRLRDAVDLLVLVLLAVAAWYLWPASIGGSTRFVVVEGQSMEPVYHVGDVVLVKSQSHPNVGDVIVFHVPDGEPGERMLVVHRVHSIRPDGSYETKGDNRELADPWHVRSDDIVGVPQVTLPNMGRVVGICSKPVVVGAAAGVLTVLFLWPKRKVVHLPHHHHDGEDAADTEDDSEGYETAVDVPVAN